MKYWLTTSIVAHVLLLFLVQITFSDMPEETSEEWTEIEFYPAPQTSTLATARKDKVFKRIPKKLTVKEAIPLSVLVPIRTFQPTTNQLPIYRKGDLDPKNPPSHNLGKMNKNSYDTYSENGVYHTMNNLTADTYSPMIPFFELFFQRIQQYTDYPKDFAQQRIQGKVYAHFMVDHRGVFTGKLLKLSSDNTYLKTYIAAILNVANKYPLPKSRWLKDRSSIPISITFHFRTHTQLGYRPTKESFHHKNSLDIYRTAYVDPKLLQYLAAYTPPIIPIPGGFMINFVAAYRLFAEDSLQKKETDRLNRINNQQRLLNKLISKPDTSKKKKDRALLVGKK